MQTILYQGKPAEGGDWLALPVGMDDTYRKLGYSVRELVLREDAEKAKVEHFNAALEQAAAVVRAELGLAAGATLVKLLMAKKLPVQAEVVA